MNNRVHGLEIVSKAGIMSIALPDPHAFTQLPDVECAQVILYNNTGAALTVRYCLSDGSARPGESTIDIADGAAMPMRGLRNANNIAVDGADGAAFAFMYEAV